MATNSTALDVAELIKLCLKTFWSATWMEAPPILLQPEQFGGWMTVLHTLLVRPVPEVRAGGLGQIYLHCHLQPGTSLSLHLLPDCPCSIIPGSSPQPAINCLFKVLARVAAIPAVFSCRSVATSLSDPCGEAGRRPDALGLQAFSGLCDLRSQSRLV